MQCYEKWCSLSSVGKCYTDTNYMWIASWADIQGTCATLFNWLSCSFIYVHSLAQTTIRLWFEDSSRVIGIIQSDSFFLQLYSKLIKTFHSSAQLHSDLRSCTFTSTPQLELDGSTVWVKAFSPTVSGLTLQYCLKYTFQLILSPQIPNLTNLSDDALSSLSNFFL